MAAVTLLTFGAQAASGSSTPLDVSAGGVLRLDARYEAGPAGSSVELTFVIESGPTDAGPWTAHFERRMRQNGEGPYVWRSKERIVLEGFDTFVRARWESTVGSYNMSPSERELRESAIASLNDPKLRLGLSGERVP
jgi:hypothetical protein